MIKKPLTEEDGYVFKVGDIVTSCKDGYWLKWYTCKIISIGEDKRALLEIVDFEANNKNISEKVGDKLVNVWYTYDLKLIEVSAKSLLKTGMWVLTEDDNFGIVMLDTLHGDIIGGMNSKLSYYSHDLTNPTCPWRSIKAIYQPMKIGVYVDLDETTENAVLEDMLEKGLWELVWEREGEEAEEVKNEQYKFSYNYLK